MLDSAIFETVFGLIFVFYATAVVCSGAVEMFANWTKKRAKYLLRGLRELLDDPGTLRTVSESAGPGAATTMAAPGGQAAPTMIMNAAAPGDEKAHYDVALGRSLKKGEEAVEARLKALWSTRLINHALLKPYKHYNRLGEPTRNPAYLPPSAFVLALLDLVQQGKDAQRAADLKSVRAAEKQPAEPALPAPERTTGEAAQKQPDDPAPPAPERATGEAAQNQPDKSNLLKVINILRREAKDDAAKLQADLEAWFNGQMDRITGSYKRWAKRLAIPIALVIAFSFNIDTVAIARSLYTDGAVRSAVLSVAASGNACPSATNEASASTACLNTTITGLRELKLPIGWSGQRFAQVQAMNFWQVVTKLFGLLLTTVAASLGAPFWFDQLNRLGSLRNVGTKPSSTS
jgi:hypothetical protein